MKAKSPKLMAPSLALQVIESKTDRPMQNNRWSVEKADAMKWLRKLPNDCIDLFITSPPYEDDRTYKDDHDKGVKIYRGEDWVKWMKEIVMIALKKTKGLVAIVCDGSTKNFAYTCVPEKLMADLERAGFTLRKPCIYKRHSNPGGSDDWLTNKWESIICVTRGGRLPFSDNTACGHKPLFKPGGAMTNRGKDDERTRQEFVNPEIANPGNIIDCGAVGGGHMGHPLTRHNEAPFPLKIPEFFIKTFTEPNMIVCDPFVGSGTTVEAAIGTGRKCISCDIRQSQVRLTERRMATVTPPLFAG